MTGGFDFIAGSGHRVINWSTIGSEVNVENSEVNEIRMRGYQSSPSGQLTLKWRRLCLWSRRCLRRWQQQVCSPEYSRRVHAPASARMRKATLWDHCQGGNRGGPPSIFFLKILYNRSMIIGRDGCEERERERLSNVGESPALASGRRDQWRGNVLRVVSTVSYTIVSIMFVMSVPHHGGDCVQVR